MQRSDHQLRVHFQGYLEQCAQRRNLACTERLVPIYSTYNLKIDQHFRTIMVKYEATVPLSMKTLSYSMISIIRQTIEVLRELC